MERVNAKFLISLHVRCGPKKESVLIGLRMIAVMMFLIKKKVF